MADFNERGHRSHEINNSGHLYSRLAKYFVCVRHLPPAVNAPNKRNTDHFLLSSPTTFSKNNIQSAFNYSTSSRRRGEIFVTASHYSSPGASAQYFYNPPLHYYSIRASILTGRKISVYGR